MNSKEENGPLSINTAPTVITSAPLPNGEAPTTLISSASPSISQVPGLGPALLLPAVSLTQQRTANWQELSDRLSSIKQNQSFLPQQPQFAQMPIGGFLLDPQKMQFAATAAGLAFDTKVAAVAAAAPKSKAKRASKANKKETAAAVYQQALPSLNSVMSQSPPKQSLPSVASLQRSFPNGEPQANCNSFFNAAASYFSGVGVGTSGEFYPQQVLGSSVTSTQAGLGALSTGYGAQSCYSTPGTISSSHTSPAKGTPSRSPASGYQTCAGSLLIPVSNSEEVMLSSAPVIGGQFPLNQNGKSNMNVNGYNACQVRMASTTRTCCSFCVVHFPHGTQLKRILNPNSQLHA
ncbi:hypothetical protein Ciccas_002866 [Cichlidogyrus casuarinus]|uniref:Uncharacterized protein n=1 Tax=Cichlidogyrus casuarinus TaxID=1844966 RepID=A0ABD2QJ94_9PLAT